MTAQPITNVIIDGYKDQLIRLDFFQVTGGWRVNKIARVLGRERIVIINQYQGEFDLDGAIAWCEAHGWTVRRWPGGARAWFGKPWPIRTRGEIIKLRTELVQHPDPRLQGHVTAMDFAFDY